MTESASASAPASTANLGPAFDCMALALKPRCTVHAQPADEWSVEHVGGHRPGNGEGDGVLVAARRAVGESRPLTLKVDSEIPIGKGLGSSAAAFVAGTAAALRAVGEEPPHDRVFRLAAEMEGHPDQVAASVYGGLIMVPAEGLPMRLPLHPSLRPVVAVPDTRLPTEEARAVLARNLPRDLVIRSLARVAALTAGLISGDPELLAAAHGDEIHEAPRDHLSPEVGRLIEVARRAGAFHAARSGAGPSVVAIVGLEAVDSVSRAFRKAGAEVINDAIDTAGLV
ncbi:MAG TPA: homoserine kinase [Acidimicrobiia bacterium]|nr:homoserine kinase [Acidimicrobiia bacterium]